MTATNDSIFRPGNPLESTMTSYFYNDDELGRTNGQFISIL